MLNINSNNFSLNCLEYNESREIQIKKPTSYNDIRICFVEKGSAVWNIDGKNYNINVGDIIILTHLQKRHFVSYSKSGFKMQFLSLKRQAFINTTHLLFLMKFTKETPVLQDSTLLSLLEKTVEEHQKKAIGYYEIISSYLTQFWVHLERQYNFSPEKAAKPDRKLIKILDYVDNNIGEEISLKKVSRMANMTESSFSRHFSKCMGIGFKQYVMARKIETAIFLLKNSNKKVIDIALECGFSSISGFYDAFKKQTGTTPNKLSNMV